MVTPACFMGAARCRSPAEVMAPCMVVITHNQNIHPIAVWSRDCLSAPRMGLKVQQMDEIMGRSVITIISLHPQGGSAGSSGGGQVIDGLGSAFSVVILFTMPNDGSQRKMWLFSLTNV